MDPDKLVTILLVQATELGTLIKQAKSEDAALYLQGCRDTLRSLAKAFQQACPLAVALFQRPVEVVDV